MQVLKIKISKLKNNTGQIEGVNKNPRIQDDAKFQKLKKSLQDFPEMLELRELVVFPLDSEFIVVGGNMRLKALKELGEKEAVCKVLPSDFTPEKINEFIIKDNVSFGLWDNTELSEWDAELLNEWGFEVPEWEVPDYSDKNKEIDVSEYSDKMKIVLEFTEEDYHKVRDGFAKIASTPEAAIFNLLNLHEA
jgi:hypothetical protein